MAIPFKQNSLLHIMKGIDEIEIIMPSIQKREI